MAYVVCQTGKCQQTYLISSLEEEFNLSGEPESFKNLKCKKCNGILTDERGNGNISQNPDVIPVIKPEEVVAQKEKELEESRAEVARIEARIKELEAEMAEARNE